MRSCPVPVLPKASPVKNPENSIMLLTPTAPGCQGLCNMKGKQSWTGPLSWVLEPGLRVQGGWSGVKTGTLSIYGGELWRGCLGSRLYEGDGALWWALGVCPSEGLWIRLPLMQPSPPGRGTRSQLPRQNRVLFCFSLFCSPN